MRHSTKTGEPKRPRIRRAKYTAFRMSGTRIMERQQIEALTDLEAVATARGRFRHGLVEVWLHRFHVATFEAT